MIDKLEFFREATQSITSDLKIEKAMPEFFKYIKGVMPLDAITHINYNPDIGSIRIRSMRTETFSLQPNKTIPLSEKSKQFYQWPFDREVVLLNNPKNFPLGRQVMNYFHQYIGENIGSVILARIIYDEQFVGYTGFHANGNSRYTQEHVDLIEMLLQVIRIVARNSISFFDQAQQVMDLTEENRFLYQEFKRIAGDKIIGADSGLKDIMLLIKQLSQVNTPVIIMGETGVGKELVADAIQQNSERSTGPYIKVNCGAIPDSLMDSELFGHEKGSFTGANSTQKGRFERANRGTIFLDEVGELALAAQVRLLRVLQNKEIERIGGKSIIPIDIRVIAATHRDLLTMVKDGSFREDLYFRLNVFPVTVPPLRHRIEDIPALLDHFVEKLASRMKLSRMPHIATDALNSLLDYNWPGNIRELENLVERALILNPGGPLEFEGLLNPYSPFRQVAEDKKIKALDEMVRQHILLALHQAGGKISGTSGAGALLGMHPNTLRSKMVKLGIKFRQFI